MKETIRILGIDPGSQITGFGLIDVCGDRARLVESGNIRTSGDHSARLRRIFSDCSDIVGKYRPGEIAIERVFVSKNADSALKLGQARAAALCATFDLDLPVFEYAPRQIKRSVVGNGGADKSQVQIMVKMLLSMQTEPQSDTADALAAALCHSHERASQIRIREAALQS